MGAFKAWLMAQEWAESILSTPDHPRPPDDRPIAAWDFDQTITKAIIAHSGRHSTPEPNPAVVGKMRMLADQGWRNIIVTARGANENKLLKDRDHPLGSINVYKAARQWGLPVASRDIFLLGGTSLGSGTEEKGPFLKRMRVRKFFDDSPKNIASAQKYGIDAELIPPLFTTDPRAAQIAPTTVLPNLSLSLTGR